jgi:cytochrome c oxidase cbb3-type subunit 3/ubiquinol-cytochrome c reductase cytochrome c subunit
MTARTRRAIGAIAIIVAAVFAAGCDSMPGRPGPEEIVPRPSAVLEFSKLYEENCAGCHGPNGRFGAAIPLNNRTYLAMVDDDTLRNVISNGVAGTAMPPFLRQSGGQLTARQIGVLIAGMRSNWQGGAHPAAGQPPYAGTGGDPAKGAQVYVIACQSCHGPGGKGTDKAGSIVDPSYLSLVSSQNLRAIVIAGRPDLGHPDWSGYVAGKPLDAGQVTDLIAWLTAQKPVVGIVAPMAAP